MFMRTLSLALLCVLCCAAALAAEPEAWAAAKAAQAFRAKGQPVTAATDGALYCEAEEFQPAAPEGWEAKPWGENYYAATFANTFLSRKAFLGAPAQCGEATAGLNVQVPEAGHYLVLARYEAAYRFETQFDLRITQGGREVFRRRYGARANPKIWAFGEKVKPEVAWPWGAVENVVWEGHDAGVDLQAGPAVITLIANRQPEPAAKRNVDLVMLTRDAAGVQKRIDTEGYLPLDGLLTQAGDVWLRASNPGAAAVTVSSLAFPGGSVQQHSPYWVHQRTWQPINLTVQPRQTTDWVEVGGTLDTLNDGQWGFTTSGACDLEFAVRTAAGTLEPLRRFPAVTGTLELVGAADMRYARLLRTTREATDDLVAYLRKLPEHGKLPARTPFFAFSGIIDDLRPLYGLRDALKPESGLIDLRSLTPAQLEDTCRKMSEAERNNITVVSLGDEIGLAVPEGDAADESFRAYLKAQGLAPAQIDPAAGQDWGRIHYAPQAAADAQPGLFYWSRRFQYQYGLQHLKSLTDVLRKYLPNAGIGANYSPHGGARHAYLGEVSQWVNVFREGAMTMPWGEDYIWQLPVGTPQMNSLNLDMFRAGLRGKPDGKILYYVMPHMPGNTPDMWRRMFYSAMGHGAKIFHLFEFDPVWAAYTENHVTGNSMYGMVLRTMREYGLYEDIVQQGQVRPGTVGLWCSETADIWDDYADSGGAAKRGLYVTILQQHLPLDVVVEQDALDGTLANYKVLYLTDRHVSRAASQALAQWVRDGGRIFATAGAGMYDEYNQPNTVLRELFGVEELAFQAPEEARVDFIKQDLPFVKPLDQVSYPQAPPVLQAGYPAFGAVSRVRVTARDVQLVGIFRDRSPAVVQRMVGRGGIMYCGFLPGLSYFKPGIPLKPLDRGSSDDAMAHLMPALLDWKVGSLVSSPVPAGSRPVEVYAATVETTVIESPVGTAITLTNWTTVPMKGLKCRVNIPVPLNNVSLASGNEVTMEEVDGHPVFTLDLAVADTLILR